MLCRHIIHVVYTCIYMYTLLQLLGRCTMYNVCMYTYSFREHSLCIVLHNIVRLCIVNVHEHYIYCIHVYKSA